jgi:heme A synthase
MATAHTCGVIVGGLLGAVIVIALHKQPSTATAATCAAIIIGSIIMAILLWSITHLNGTNHKHIFHSARGRLVARIAVMAVVLVIVGAVEVLHGVLIKRVLGCEWLLAMCRRLLLRRG